MEKNQCGKKIDASRFSPARTTTSWNLSWRGKNLTFCTVVNAAVFVSPLGFSRQFILLGISSTQLKFHMASLRSSEQKYLSFLKYFTCIFLWSEYFSFFTRWTGAPRFRKPLKIRPFVSLEVGLLHLFFPPDAVDLSQCIHLKSQPRFTMLLFFFFCCNTQNILHFIVHELPPRFASLGVLIFSSKSQRLSTNTPRVGMLVADRTLFEKIKEQLTDMLQILSHTLKRNKQKTLKMATK